jgi:hypothetical protein
MNDLRAGTMLTPAMMTPMERQTGRFMRGPDHPGAGDAPPNPGDNTAVIPPAGATGDSGGDNNGQEFDADAFWKAGDEGGDAPDPLAEAKELGTQLTSALNTMTFGGAVVDDSVAKELEQGNYANFNARLEGQLRMAARQTLAQSLNVMKVVEAQIMRKAEAQIAAALGNRDSQADLFAAIPSAKDPAVRPQIQAIYDQAMKVTKGNSKAALEMTKSMAAMVAKKMAPDLGLNFAPGNPGDSAPSPTNWMDELMGK